MRTRTRWVAGAIVASVGLGLTAAVAPESPVADAAMRAQWDEVRELIDRGADVNAAQGDGMTALHWAARNGSLEVARLLLEHDADPTATTRNGAYTPLHLASQSGQAELVETLVEAGSDPNRPTTTGGAVPLHFAAASGSAGAIEALLKGGANVNATDDAWGQTALMFAASYNRVDAIRALVAGGAALANTSTVVDIAERARQDRLDRQRRNARLRAAAAGQDPAAAERERQEAERRATQEEREAAEAQRLAQLEQMAQRESESRMIEEPEPLSYGELVGGQGGLTALLQAAREGHLDAAMALLEAGADINQKSAGDGTSPMLMAMVNGHFDLALKLFEEGADPALASDAGATPLFAAINTHWAPKSRYPQQHAYTQQQATYLDVMRTLLNAGVDPNVRLTKHLWYMSYNFDLLQIDTKGATPFWRAAYSLDIDAMELLVEFGADPSIPTEKVPARRFRRGPTEDLSGLPPVPVGGPAVYPIHAASGVGYGQGFAANAHRHTPDGWLPAVTYLVEVLGADVNARDHNGYSAVHHAASRGDTELIRYLHEQGADVTVLSRVGQTTADMANGPYQRTQPYPDAVALLESLGSANSHNCVSC